MPTIDPTRQVSLPGTARPWPLAGQARQAGGLRGMLEPLAGAGLARVAKSGAARKSGQCHSGARLPQGCGAGVLGNVWRTRGGSARLIYDYWECNIIYMGY